MAVGLLPCTESLLTISTPPPPVPCLQMCRPDVLIPSACVSSNSPTPGRVAFFLFHALANCLDREYAPRPVLAWRRGASGSSAAGGAPSLLPPAPTAAPGPRPAPSFFSPPDLFDALPASNPTQTTSNTCPAPSAARETYVCFIPGLCVLLHLFPAPFACGTVWGGLNAAWTAHRCSSILLSLDFRFDRTPHPGRQPRARHPPLPAAVVGVACPPRCPLLSLDNTLLCPLARKKP